MKTDPENKLDPCANIPPNNNCNTCSYKNNYISLNVNFKMATLGNVLKYLENNYFARYLKV